LRLRRLSESLDRLLKPLKRNATKQRKLNVLDRKCMKRLNVTLLLKI
jgi:hypothetical protein